MRVPINCAVVVVEARMVRVAVIKTITVGDFCGSLFAFGGDARVFVTVLKCFRRVFFVIRNMYLENRIGLLLD